MCSGLGRDEHEVVAVERDHVVGDGSGRYQLRPVVARRAEREGGDARAVDHTVGRGADPREEARGHRVLGERGRREPSTERLDRQRQVEDAGAPAAVGLGHAHAGRAHVDELAPEIRGVPEGLVGP